MRALDRALARLAGGLSGAGIAVVLLMALHITADVLARFLFNAPLAGTLEIVANYYMVGLIFAPLALVQRTDGHIAADFLSGFLGPRVRRALDAVIALAMTAFAGVLIWRTSIEALRSIDTLEAVQTSGYFVYIFPARWFIPVGLGAMALCAFARFLQCVGGPDGSAGNGTGGGAGSDTSGSEVRGGPADG